MLQLIGLIVAAYSLARLAQIPFEPLATRGDKPALVILACISIGGGVVVGFLALLLLASGTQPGLPQ